MVSTNTVSTNSNLLMVSKIPVSTNSIHYKHNEYRVLIVCTNRVGTNSTPQM